MRACLRLFSASSSPPSLIQVAVFSTTIYLHRTATHRALIAASGGRVGVPVLAVADDRASSTKEWVAVHRKHHAFTDEEGDPHSPVLDGLLVRAARQRLPLRQAKRRTPTSSSGTRATSRTTGGTACSSIAASLGLDDRHRRAVLRARHRLGPARGGHSRRRCTCSCCRRRSTASATTSATRTSTTPRPTSGLLALLTGGEGLHNNHHGYPRSPKFSFRASEIDPAWPVIKLLIALEAREAVQDDRRSRRPSERACEVARGSGLAGLHRRRLIRRRPTTS